MPRHLLPVLLAMGAFSCFAQVEFVQEQNQTLVRINGKDFTSLQVGNDAHKPYLYPLRTASGKLISRGFPDQPQPGEDRGAPHQMGIWVGHESISGVDYFEVDPRGRKNRPTGAIRFKDLTAATGGARQGVLAFVDDWIHPNGTVILTEHRAFRFYAEPKDARIVDVEIRLHAAQDIELADHKDALLGIRLGKAFQEQNGSQTGNYLGQHGAAALNGTRALWVSNSAVVDGEPVTVTLMDHPGNYNFPTRWRVDPRGFIFASAFGERTFFPANGTPPPTVRNAGVSLKASQEILFRYRVVIHGPDLDCQAVWLQFAQAPASNLTLTNADSLLTK